MAQMQKHWIQSLLNENTYVPFPYFYDVSGWSNPLLFNVSGGRSGGVLSPAAELVAPLGAPRAAPLPAPLPRVAVYQISGGTSARESTGWLRYLLEQEWGLPYQRVTSAQIAAGALADFDVLLVPNGVSTTASNALGPAGRKALLAQAGGQYFQAEPMADETGTRGGVAFGYEGSPSWVLLTVDPAHRAAVTRGELTTKDGRTIALPSLELDRNFSWAGAIPVNLYKVASIRLLGDSPGEILQASFPRGVSDGK
jgi:hypothetical protein